MSVIRARKFSNFFIKPGFQSRLTAIMILLVIIVANLVGALLYFFAYEKLTLFFTENKLPVDVSTLTKLLLPGVLLSELISIFAIGILCIKITHTIAGPVYRMERVAKAIGEGDLTNFIKLRQKDELKDLADSMNDMTMGLRNKITIIKDSIDEIHEHINKANNSNDALKIDYLTEKLNNIDDTLKLFILDKEQRVRIESEEDETSSDENDDEVENKEDKKDGDGEYSSKSNDEYK